MRESTPAMKLLHTLTVAVLLAAAPAGCTDLAEDCATRKACASTAARPTPATATRGEHMDYLHQLLDADSTATASSFCNI